MKYSCGCINETDSDSGVLHCIKKCEFHIAWSVAHSQGESIEYFKEMGCFDERGIIQNKRLIDEFKDAFSEIMDIDDLYGWDTSATMLEIGPGLGMYIPMFLEWGWEIYCCEMASFACDWIRNAYPSVNLIKGAFENFKSKEQYELIFGAHVFEHIENAPAMLKKAYELLQPEVGLLFLILPDDTDLTNPDHWWFFTEKSLGALLKKLGFVKIRMNMRKIVPHENFIYCVAEKP